MEDKELIKAIVKTSILELDLQMTRSINATNDSVNEVKTDVKLLRQEIPALIDKKIKNCQNDQKNNKRWNIRTLLILLGLLASYGFSAYAVFGS